MISENYCALKTLEKLTLNYIQHEYENIKFENVDILGLELLGADNECLIEDDNFNLYNWIVDILFDKLLKYLSLNDINVNCSIKVYVTGVEITDISINFKESR